MIFSNFDSAQCKLRTLRPQRKESIVMRKILLFILLFLFSFNCNKTHLEKINQWLEKEEYEKLLEYSYKNKSQLKDEELYLTSQGISKFQNFIRKNQSEKKFSDPKYFKNLETKTGLKIKWIQTEAEKLIVIEDNYQSLIKESKYYKDSGIAEDADFVFINNTSNIHLDIMRPDMLVSGLLSIAYNLNRQQSNLSVFEFGKSYRKIQNGYREVEMFTIFMSGKKNEESWLSDNKIEKTFFDIKKPVLSVLQRVGINSYQASEITDGSRFSYGIKIHRGPVTIAEFGEVKKTHCRKMGIKVPLFYAEISFDVLLTMMGKEKMQVKEISRIHYVRRDLAKGVGKKVRF